MPQIFKRSTIPILLCFVGVLSSQALAEPVEFKPTFAKRMYQTTQPFSGMIEFVNTPAFNKPATLRVTLTSHAELDTTQHFQFVTSGLRAAKFEPADLYWEPPIDSGATKTLEATFLPEWVGGYEILFSRKIGHDWQDIERIILTYDEDGKILCQGPLSVCGAPVVPMHPHRASKELRLSFPQIPVRKGQPANRDFSADFRLLTPISRGETTLVEVSLECQRNLYREVQFVAEHSTNLKIEQLPESWGNSVGVNPNYRFLTDTLSFVLLRDGLSYLNFEVVGRHPHANRGNHITTSFPIYFVTSEQGELLYFGDFEPIKRYGSVNKSLLGTLTHLPESGSSDFRVKYQVSKPDFRAQADSVAADSAASKRH